MALENRQLLALTTLASFNITNGETPEGGVVLDSQGNLYGTTYGGGADGYGTVFEIAKGSNTITTLASFNGTNGANPHGGLVLDSQGNLYGTTFYGGAAGVGTVFEIAKGSNTITTLASFNLASGEFPDGGVVLDSQGNLYGTTQNGGAYGVGTVFEVAKGSNTITTLASFNGTNGWSPDSVVLDSQGNLYGTAPYGGAYDDGTEFEIAKGSSTISTLASFNGTNGVNPQSLVLDGQGNLYGTTYYGGAYNDGTVFEIGQGSSNTITTLASFSGTNGANPHGGLVLDSQGNLYGTTGSAVASVWGTVFELANGSSTITTLDSFNGTHGVFPISTVLDGQGNLYRTASGGGAGGYGTVFELSGVGLHQQQQRHIYGGVIQQLHGHDHKLSHPRPDRGRHLAPRRDVHRQRRRHSHPQRYSGGRDRRHLQPHLQRLQQLGQRRPDLDSYGRPGPGLHQHQQCDLHGRRRREFPGEDQRLPGLGAEREQHRYPAQQRHVQRNDRRAQRYSSGGERRRLHPALHRLQQRGRLPHPDIHPYGRSGASDHQRQ
jgi:uncharacterized repeat protein (TIGR03803 family)